VRKDSPREKKDKRLLPRTVGERQVGAGERYQEFQPNKAFRKLEGRERERNCEAQRRKGGKDGGGRGKVARGTYRSKSQMIGLKGGDSRWERGG